LAQPQQHLPGTLWYRRGSRCRTPVWLYARAYER